MKLNLKHVFSSSKQCLSLFSFEINITRSIKLEIFTVTSNVQFRAFAMSTDMESDNNWRGVPLSEIRGSQSPWGSPEFPLVAPSFNHAVLYHIPSSGCVPGDRPPKPQIGQDKWDHEFVRMPCSSKSLYPVEDSSGETHLKKRWELIETALSKPICNSRELADAILSYNTQFKNTWRFRALHKLFNEHLEEEESQYFFDVTLPEIAKLALALPKLIQAPIPLLKQHKNRSISLSQQQISSLLANAFFCTFPRRNSTKKTSEYASFPHINFITLYETSGSDSVLEKLKCFCHYFKRVCSKAPVGCVTFARRSVPPRRLPTWPECARTVGSVPLHVDSTGTIEDADQLIQMDFANKYLGGGVLGHGCVQEEIRFAISPELMGSMLFTEVLRPNEALMIIGCERYSKYTGYGSSFQWAGAFHERAPMDSSSRRRVAVLALDAAPYANGAQQYRPSAILRELNKAWVGFSFFAEEDPSGPQFPGVATGNWGCGAFGGTPRLKGLLQLMAAARARRPLAYHTFRDAALRDDLVSVYNLLARFNVTVGQLYSLIVRFCETDVRKLDLHAFIERVLIDEGAPKSVPRPQEVTKSQDTTNPQDVTKPLDMTKPQVSAKLQEANNEQMDISDISDKCEIELPESLQKELMNESPDFFTPEEAGTETQIMDCGEIDIKTNSDKAEQTTQKDSENKMATGADKMAVSDNKMAPGLTSSLFDEMNKFDQNNGRLNLSKSHTSILKTESPKVKTNKMDTSTEVGEKPADPVSEVKRKMARKITDYYSKKSI